MPDSDTISVLFPELAKVVAGHFRIKPASITPSTTAMDIAGWDSVTHTMLLIEIEQHFQVRLDESEGFRAVNVGELAALIEKARGTAAK